MYYIVSKLFKSLFLSPGIFIFVLFLSAFYAKKFKMLFFFVALFLLLLSSKFFSNILIYPLEHNYECDDITPKAVVVLGGGVYKYDVLKASPDAFKREIYGMLLAKKENIPFIFTGGGAKGEESEGAKQDIDYIKKIFNLKLKKEYYENKSLNTYENAKYTARLFEKLNIPKEIYLVTTAYHMKRAIKAFKHFGFKIIPKPVGFNNLENNNYFNLFPNFGSLLRSYKALHEYFGLLAFKLMGVY